MRSAFFAEAKTSGNGGERNCSTVYFGLYWAPSGAARASAIGRARTRLRSMEADDPLEGDAGDLQPGPTAVHAAMLGGMRDRLPRPFHPTQAPQWPCDRLS